MSERLAGLDHTSIAFNVRPTPGGGMVEFRCQGCGERSVPVPPREVMMWAVMHATGVAGLPGTRVGMVEQSWMERDEADYFAPQVSEEDEQWWKEVMAT